MKILIEDKQDKSKKMAFSYGSDGFLVSWEVAGEWTREQWREFYAYPPLRKELVSSYGRAYNIRELQDDTSFSAFWEAYRYKVGSKDRAEKLWGQMSETERVAALAAIPKYLYYLQVKQVGQAYPETWLAQRRWENEYK